MLLFGDAPGSHRDVLGPTTEADFSVGSKIRPCSGDGVQNTVAVPYALKSEESHDNKPDRRVRADGCAKGIIQFREIWLGEVQSNFELKMPTGCRNEKLSFISSPCMGVCHFRPAPASPDYLRCTGEIGCHVHSLQGVDTADDGMSGSVVSVAHPLPSQVTYRQRLFSHNNQPTRSFLISLQLGLRIRSTNDVHLV